MAVIKLLPLHNHCHSKKIEVMPDRINVRKMFFALGFPFTIITRHESKTYIDHFISQ